MATPAIIRGSDHFFNVIYEGNGRGQRVGNFIPFTDNGTIAKSIISNPADNPQLTYDISGETATSADKWTLSVWIKRSGTGSTQYFAGTSIDGNNESKLGFDSSDRAYWVNIAGGTTTAQMISNRTFEDTSKWYHIVWSMDSTQSTAANRARLYVDGDEITSWSTATYITQNNDYIWTTGDQQRINWSSGEDLDGYIAEINNVDGQQLGPDTFGVTDTSTGRWIPKSLGSITYGGTGYRLTFANSAGQTIGDDTSGNGHDFTVSNFTVSDITTDSPTQNFNNMGGDKDTGGSTSEGNLKAVTPSSGGGYNQIVALPSFGVSKGKWYWEARITDNNSCILGWKDDGNNGGSQASVGGGAPGNISGICCGSSGSFSDGELSIDTGYSGPDLGTTNNNDIFMFALDLDNQRAFIGQNGSWLNSDNPATPTDGVGGLSRIGNGLNVYPAMARLDNSATAVYNFGQNPSFSGGITAAANTASSGPGLFKYTPPTDYKALCQDNLPDNSKDLADFVWIKNRDQADAHALYDSSRGPLNEWHISEDVPAAVPDGLTKFMKGGFAIEDNDAVNSDSESYVAWCWHANGGTTAANTAGSGANVATTVQANQTAGFSICEFTGTGSNLRFAHGLSQAPEWIIIKRLEGSGAAQQVYHVGYGADQYVQLNEADAKVTTGAATTNFIETPTATYVDLGSNSNSNNSGDKSVAYCWHSVAGFSKFGIYLGNGSANGPLVITGFKPAWLMIKDVDNTRNWVIVDSTRDTFNPTDKGLFPNDSAAEATGNTCDLLSNGFKPRSSGTSMNASAAYIYMAFAEHPFLGSGTNPVTAR